MNPETFTLKKLTRANIVAFAILIFIVLLLLELGFLKQWIPFSFVVFIIILIVSLFPIIWNLTLLVRPPVLRIYEDRLEVVRWKFLGLNQDLTTVSISKIASVQKKEGIIYARLSILASGDIPELSIPEVTRKEAVRITELVAKKSAQPSES